MEEKKEPRRISEVSKKPAFEGEPITIEDILDEEVLITGFASRVSQFEDREFYLVIQVEHEGKKKVLTTGSQVVMDAFDSITPEDLPLRGKFIKIEGAKGRRYYQVV